MDRYFQLGLNEDLKGNYKAAVDFYIQSVENEEMCLDAHLNLMVILIEVVFDYGVTSNLINKGIYEKSEIDGLFEYLNSLTQKTEILFDSNEVSFWKYYKEAFYQGLDRKAIVDIINQDKNSLIPYFPLYITDLESQMGVSSYVDQINKLKKALFKSQTIKNKYVLSLIESAENLKI
ncbi:MAG: hypothetical protein AAGI25_11935 [Bacteroidota bacterium]